MERIGMIVVHGVGEQGCFEHLEAIASNLYKALQAENRQPHIQIFPGGQASRGGATGTWKESPVCVRWKKESGEEIEASFWEVHWADLDLPRGVWNWLKLVGWALAMPGVRRFNPPAAPIPPLVFPGPLSRLEAMKVRLQLFAVSFLFFLILLSVDLLYFACRRFYFQAAWLSHIRGLIYDYLGDVKLYQDGFNREDEAIETVGERTRVAIQRRMMRVLTRVARKVACGKLDGYYILSHSLGTVVAFNTLMEHEWIWPHYLNEREYRGLPSAFKRTYVGATGSFRPSRPSWLGPTDAINRDVLFSGLRGWLTLGSPLDKFAALWPAIVPTHPAPIGRGVPWVNVADKQDIVAGPIDLFPGSTASPKRVGFLELQNIAWADQWTLLTAHTRYWKTDQTPGRLINRLLSWFEGGLATPFIPPQNRISPCCATALFCLACVGGGLLALVAAAFLFWSLGTGIAMTIQWVMSKWVMSHFAMASGVTTWLQQMGDTRFLDCLLPVSTVILITGAITIIACSLIRYVWEWWTWK